MAYSVYAGAVGPETYALDITPGTTGVDLSTVTAAILYVRKSDGSETTWAVAMSNQTATTLTVTHVYVSGDVDLSGDYVAFAVLTIPSGAVRNAPDPIRVRGRFET